MKVIDDAHVREVLAGYQASVDQGFADIVSGFYYNGLYERSILAPKIIELCAISALTVTHVLSVLKQHVRYAFKAGANEAEIKEAIVQMVTYCGLPRVSEALDACEEVIEERRQSGLADNKPGPKVAKGYAELALGEAYVRNVLEGFAKRIDNSFAAIIGSLAFKGLYARAVVEPKVRQFCTISALTMIGVYPILTAHIKHAFESGATEAEVREVILQMTAYCGIPMMNQALATFDAVVKEHNSGGDGKH